MDEKKLTKMLNKVLGEFPWLWAIHEKKEWNPYTYDHIFIKRAEPGDFTTVINKNYDVQAIWVKTTIGSSQFVNQVSIPEKNGLTAVTEIIRNRFNDYVTIDSIVIVELRRISDQKNGSILTIYKKPKGCEFLELFRSRKVN